jgi:hypothetical protein
MEEPHPFHQGARGDAAAGEQYGFTGSQFFRFVDLIGVGDAHFLKASNVAVFAFAN